jgi:hypothetical protein
LLLFAFRPLPTIEEFPSLDYEQGLEEHVERIIYIMSSYVECFFISGIKTTFLPCKGVMGV